MQINPDKTEAMIIGSKHQLKKFNAVSSLLFSGTTVSFVDNIKIVGVTLDSSLSFDKHVSLICQACNFHMRALRHIRPLLSFDFANQLACSIVASRIDYCNSLFYGMSKHNIDKLQRLQNNLARIVCCAPARASAAPLLKRLHWLPIEQRIEYKIACMSFNVLHSHIPNYLNDLIVPYVPPRNLRSSTSNLLSVPNSSHLSAAANRSFSFAAPIVWNSLSANTRSATSIDNFKRCLKTELFISAFNVNLP